MRILVVDQSADNAAIVRMAFSDRHHVTVVSDRDEAERSLAARPGPELLVLDYGLPNGWGLALCRKVKARATSPPVIILTAVSHLVPEARTCADVVLEKPFDPDRLRAEGERLLRPT